MVCDIRRGLPINLHTLGGARCRLHIHLYMTDDIRRRLHMRVIYDRGSIVPQTFVGSEVRIRSGSRLHTRFLNRWMVGFKYGEFSWTRKLALYKAKQLKKKKKKK